MHAQLLQIADHIRKSYWFIPALLSILAIATAFVTSWVDYAHSSWFLESVPWLQLNQPSGARSLLATAAGSMITVAGVTFSLTISAVIFAAGNMGPRLLDAFLRDRGNQITLGTFTATFIYCLLVLRTVRDSTETTDGFVPHLGTTVAILLTLCSVGVWIYYLHHIPESMHVSNVIAAVGRELEEQITEPFPTGFGKPASGPVELPGDFDRLSVGLELHGTGFVQTLDSVGLMKAATGHDLLIALGRGPGQFAGTKQPAAFVYPAIKATDQAMQDIRNCFTVGNQRTRAQDTLYLVERLCEIAIRALSPGINDPLTARDCIDWLTNALSRLAAVPQPVGGRVDASGQLRIVARPIDFLVVAEQYFNHLGPYAVADPIAGPYLAQQAVRIMTFAPEGTGQQLSGWMSNLRQNAEASLRDPGAAEAIARHEADLRRILEDPSRCIHFVRCQLPGREG